ncbi:hypothetical protein UFOVP653_11 [uncultured Caudovirales phage]|uniref:Uncharacterized protein n=1 Tax=uncultured Caudovirales phage TaxID=2100421 RepID=A0A6J5N964_9CAUD|nr:hypothetical protein UFOVP653_11 [uncultured Caudovirales phage]
MNPREGLQYSTKGEIDARISALHRELAFLEQINTGCGTCQHFVAGRVCALAGHVEPPAEVKQVGCGSWLWDGVPF